jgi:hypothetical protein
VASTVINIATNLLTVDLLFLKAIFAFASVVIDKVVAVSMGATSVANTIVDVDTYHVW